MKTITIAQAFGNAPPRSAAVLCVKGTDSCTDMVRTDWFTWLNIKRNPMISFALPRSSALGARLQTGDSFALAIPPPKEAEHYQQPISVEAAGAERDSAQEPETMAVKSLPVRVPKGTEVLLWCTLSGAYNYPFKKVRIFHCNLEESLGSTNSK